MPAFTLLSPLTQEIITYVFKDAYKMVTTNSIIKIVGLKEKPSLTHIQYLFHFLNTFPIIIHLISTMTHEPSIVIIPRLELVHSLPETEK